VFQIVKERRRPGRTSRFLVYCTPMGSGCQLQPDEIGEVGAPI
jgi:hypothetical protein